MKTYDVTIREPQHGMRLDLALVDADLGLSRRKIREVIDVGGCYVNRKRIRIASRKVFTGDKVRLEYNLEGLKQAKKQNFVFKPEDILYEDEQLVAVNKPPGLASQATKSQSVVHVEAVLKEYYKSSNLKVPKLVLVHRLDKETSGVILLAKSTKMGAHLMDLFRSRDMKKFYWAVVKGIPRKKEFSVHCQLSPILKRDGLVKVVKSGGKTSETKFKVIGENDVANVCLIECRPKTGRSHQLRVHLESAGHPIVGDKRYGNNQTLSDISAELKGLTTLHHFLHAKSLEIPKYEKGRSLVVHAPLPTNMEQFSASLNLH